MTTMTRLRRSAPVRKMMFALALLIGACTWYVSGYFSWYWIGGRQIVRGNVFHAVKSTLFGPIEWFNSSSTDTAAYVQGTADWCYTLGQGTPRPWGELVKYYLDAKWATAITAPLKPSSAGSASEPVREERRRKSTES
jgi:hypothetical protein